MNYRQHIEEMNYAGDRRVRARNGDGLTRDERKMTISVELFVMENVADDATDGAAEGGDRFETVIFPAKFCVCGICEGRGTHVDPSIDASGIGQDDEFWDDDTDYDDEDEDGDPPSRYARGDYDVKCYGCGGARVILQIDRDRADPKMLALYDEDEKDNDEFDAQQRAEIRAGA